MSEYHDPPVPHHVSGTARGELTVRKKGREPGRGGKKAHRTARDSTSIDPDGRDPIDPKMPYMPPA